MAPVLAGAVLGSLLPDLDTRRSTLGRWVHAHLLADSPTGRVPLLWPARLPRRH